jgi:hypothetical protein
MQIFFLPGRYRIAQIPAEGFLLLFTGSFPRMHRNR